MEYLSQHLVLVFFGIVGYSSSTGYNSSALGLFLEFSPPFVRFLSFFLFFFFFFFFFCFEVILSRVRCEIKLRLFPAMKCLFLVSRIRFLKCLLLLFF